MRVLVTGATGFLGREVTHQLGTAGHDVTAFTHSPGDLPGVRTVHGDLTDIASVRAAVTDAEAMDAVCHLAALTQARESRQHPLPYWDVNTAGTLRLLQALTDQPGTVRFVLASTGAVYGTGQSGPIPEDAPIAPTSAYGRSKAAAEDLLRDAAAAGLVTGVVIRTFNLAGSSLGEPDTDTTRVIPAALAVANGERESFGVNGDGHVVREYTHVSDVARAYVAAVELGNSEPHMVFNIGSGHGASVLDVLEAVRTVTGHAIPVEHRPAQNEPASLVADIRRAEDDLDWTPRRSDLLDLVDDAWTALRVETGPGQDRTRARAQT